MKTLVAAAICFLTVLSPPKAWAYTGNELWGLCSSRDTHLQNGCAGNLYGILTTLLWLNNSGDLPHGFCPPRNFTVQQIIDVAQGYVRDHPGQRHHPAPLLVLMSLWEAFPCR